MRGTRLRPAGKSLVSILCIASFLTMTLESVSPAVAADTWETWPRESTEPDAVQRPAPDASGAAKDWETWPRSRPVPETLQPPAADNGAATVPESLPKATADPAMVPVPVPGANAAAKDEDAAKKKASKGKFYRTIGWIALGVAAVVGIAIAAGGGGDEGGAVTNPGHH